MSRNGGKLGMRLIQKNIIKVATLSTALLFGGTQARAYPLYSLGEGYDTNRVDTPIPGFVGDDGAGSVTSNNYVNLAFAGWAEQVTDYSPAPDVDEEWSHPTNALGPVTGCNTNIVSLGELTEDQITNGMTPGMLTIKTSIPIHDDTGPDFAIFENGYYYSGSAEFFGELAFVEVSSDGTNFTRFPAISLTENAVDPYGGIVPEKVYNLCGKHANAYGRSWGTPFDLAELASTPAVSNGTLNITNICYIRIVDIPGNGAFKDSKAHPIYDPWETFGSGGSDIEALGVINSPEASRITLSTSGPGKITPYGLPFVSVRNGSNITFKIEEVPGHHLLDVRINGISIGATNRYTFVNVQSNQTISASFGNYITINSPYGNATPPTGIFGGYGDVRLQISPTHTNGQERYICTGWAGTGSLPPSGTTNDTGTFSLTTDSSITWLWNKTNYWLNTSAIPEGSLTPNGGWFAAGETASVTAASSPYYNFIGWSGDITGNTNSNPATIIFGNAPATATAHFYADTATNGVPLSWLSTHSLTNRDADSESLLDRDGDGLAAWQEFYAGTDPNNPESTFRIIGSQQRNGTNYITWIAGTNGSIRPFRVFGAKHPDDTWNLIDGNVERAPGGTNTWSHPASNLFYKIEIETD
jgi:hypothetical protein